MRKLILALALVAITGCSTHNTVTNTPPGVTSAQVNNWMSATRDLSDAQTVTHGVITSIVQLNHMTPQVIPDGPAYGAALTALGRADQLQIEMKRFLDTVPNDWSAPTQAKIADYATQVLGQLTSAISTGVLNVKDSTGALIADTVRNAIAIMQTIQALTSPAAQGFSLDGPILSGGQLPPDRYYSVGATPLALQTKEVFHVN